MTTYSYTSRKRRVRGALVAVIVAVSACSGSTPDGHVSSPAALLGLPDMSNRPVDVATPLATDEPRPGTAAPTPREAVERFVRAEAEGETDASFDLLSAADRAEVRTRIAWKAMHSSLPRLVSFVASGNVPPSPTGDAEVRGTVTYTPRLDEIGGLVTTRADVAWTVVGEDAGWRLAYQRSSVTPIYLPDSGAADSAQAWVAVRQACGTPDATLEYAGGLVGSVGIAPALCKSSPARFGPPERLGDRPSPAPVLAAFGPEADTWARTVKVTGPRTFHIVLAPHADRWIVIGLLADGA
jgi:hypothetical protein